MKIDELEKQLQEDTKCCPINRGWYQELGNDSVHHFQIPIDSIFPPKFHYELPRKLKWLSITKVVYWKVFRIIFEKKLKTYQKLKWGLVWMLFI